MSNADKIKKILLNLSKNDLKILKEKEALIGDIGNEVFLIKLTPDVDKKSLNTVKDLLGAITVKIMPVNRFNKNYAKSA